MTIAQRGAPMVEHLTLSWVKSGGQEIFEPLENCLNSLKMPSSLVLLLKKPGKNALQYPQLLLGQKYTEEEKHKYTYNSS